MARVNNRVFQYLVSSGIFKPWIRSSRASMKTIDRRNERNRGSLIWLSKSLRRDEEGNCPDHQKGTFKGSVKDTFR